MRTDDPKNRRIGFGHYRPLRHSRVIYFGLNDLKKAPQKLLKKLNKWREQHPNSEYRELAAKMLNQKEPL